jgi:hypothetical protein
MTLTFHVTNFDKHQHYRDRTPPWIKLYNELLDDYRFGKLPDHAKAHLVAIWLLASRSDNCLPLDGEWVARRINATEPVDLQVLLDAGFLKADDGAASKPLAKRKRNACPEREGETEREAEQKDLSDPPLADADQSRDFLTVEGRSEDEKTPAAPDSGGNAPPEPNRRARPRNSYPPEFEAFWAAYPTDPIMSKLRAFTHWQCLTEDDRALAMAALPAFRQHCAHHPTYHPVHAERFLSQRRFDGLAAAPPAMPPDVEAAKAAWGGAAAPLVDEIGAAAFTAYFGAAMFDAGPPARIAVSRPHLRTLIRDKHGAALRRALGAFELVAELPANTRAPPPTAPMSWPASHDAVASDASSPNPSVSWPANAGHPDGDKHHPAPPTPPSKAPRKSARTMCKRAASSSNCPTAPAPNA